MRMPAVQTRRFTRAEYDRLIEYGVLHEDEPVELLDGRLVVSEPQGGRHATAILRARRALERAFSHGHHVRDQMPIILDEASEPEPDVFVVRGRETAYGDDHPTSAVLVVEVADSSVKQDRVAKGGVYARAGIAEYWIVNLVARVLEVYREPVRVGGRWKYRRVTRLKRGATVSPLAAPRARIRVADLLP